MSDNSVYITNEDIEKALDTLNSIVGDNDPQGTMAFVVVTAVAYTALEQAEKLKELRAQLEAVRATLTKCQTCSQVAGCEGGEKVGSLNGLKQLVEQWRDAAAFCNGIGDIAGANCFMRAIGDTEAWMKGQPPQLE